MKKICLSFALVSISMIAAAQKNSILLYGNFNFSTMKADGQTRSNTFNFAPGLGYQFDEHWTSGLNYKISSIKYFPDQNPVVKQSNFGVGPFLRYTYPLSEIFFIFGQLDANYTAGKVTQGFTSRGFESNLSPAIGINLKKGFAVNFTFGGISFVSNKSKVSLIEERKYRTFGLSFGSGAGFGISKNFGL